MRVCLIEDNTLLREALALGLRDCGCEVFPAANGEAGLALAHHMSPDVLVTDMDLPRIDGVTVVARARALFPKTVIIAISGADLSSDGHLAHAMAQGADKAPQKPFSVDALCDAIHAVLKQRYALA